jgi:hypothetical protein
MPIVSAIRRGIRAPTGAHNEQLSGVSTPGAASPTLSVDQCDSGRPGSCRGSVESELPTALDDSFDLLERGLATLM